MTEKDEDDIINFGLKYGVDLIALSFTRTAEDIETVRDIWLLKLIFYDIIYLKDQIFWAQEVLR